MGRIVTGWACCSYEHKVNHNDQDRREDHYPERSQRQQRSAKVCRAVHLAAHSDGFDAVSHEGRNPGPLHLRHGGLMGRAVR